MHHYSSIGLIVVGVALIAASSYWHGTEAFASLLAKRADALVGPITAGNTTLVEALDHEFDRTLCDFKDFFYVSHWVAVLVFVLALVVVFGMMWMYKQQQ
jgi:hypothetical protein